MELHKNLLDIMSNEMISDLKDELVKSNSLQSKLINSVILNPGINNTALKKKMSVPSSTLKKIVSTAGDYLWDFNARYIETPYDDVFVLRKLLFSGKIKTGIKYYNALLKQCELKQEWGKLDMVYTEGARISQITGNDVMTCHIAELRKQNSFRLHEFTLIYSDIITEMIKLEGYSMRKPDIAKYSSYLEILHKRAVTTGHHLLIHNALHLRYLFYVRYNNSPQKVFDIIVLQKANVEANKKIMSDITYALALNTYVNFLVIYKEFGSPDPFIKELKKVISAGGEIATLNFYYAMLEYNLFENKLSEVNKWLELLKGIEDNSRFYQYRYIIFSIKAFIEKNIPLFKQHFSAFYGESSHLDFPDLEITLRLLEVITLISKREHDLAMSRLDALRIYISRNVNKDRHDDDRKLISLLCKINEGNRNIKADLRYFDKSPYRNVSFIVESIKEWLL